MSRPAAAQVQIAIVGDLHGHFDETDVAFFNNAGYDLLLFVGDLAGLSGWFQLRPAVRRLQSLLAWTKNNLSGRRQLRRMARELSQLTPPALLIPGNHDAANPLQLLAEVKGWSWLAELAGRRHPELHRRLAHWLGPVGMGGYSVHGYRLGEQPLQVIAARPYSMGGPTLAFRPLLRRLYGVNDLEESADRLRACVDAAPPGPLLFLAHNGPTGLGRMPDAIWGRDFGPAAGDWGDPDLEAAVTYARRQGRQVLGVIAGHMHWQTGQGSQRQWHQVQDGIHYVNAARVPRHDSGQRYHLHLTIADGSVSVSERRV